MIGIMNRVWTAVVAGLLTTLVIPAAAWAEQSGVAEIVQRRPRIGFGSIVGLMCCLVVVGGIVVAVLLVTRNRRRR